jgi:alkylation response protein AidB-like acyl-CoA dehydrogenase
MAAAQRLERDLANPEDRRVTFGYARCAELDDADEFPHQICRQLDELGLPRYYVPARHGGRLTSYETTAQLVRMLARRDLGVAVSHAKTYLGAVCVWVAGDEAQASRLGRRIAAGLPVAWGLTEREHGSDLLSGDLIAEAVPEAAATSYRLTGEKWPINNATRCGVMCVLARTDPAGGPRGFSLFLVDKSTLDAGTYRYLPKVRTHGNRGADISGIVLRDAIVEAKSLVGAEGSGLESVLKGLQITRTLCSALSLGCGDHALRIVMTFMLGSRGHGRRLLDLPGARRMVAVAYADHLLSEALSIVAFRAIQALTPELAVLAAVTKYLVPTRTEAAIASLRRLIGPSALLRDGQDLGSLGKVERDHRIVSLFDGNTVVNLHTLVNFFPLLSKAHEETPGDDGEALRVCCALSQPLPEARLDQLTLIPRHGLSLLRSARAAVEELTRLARRSSALTPVAGLADRLHSTMNDLLAEIGRQPRTRMDVPKYCFELAKRFAIGMAGLAAIQLWLHNHEAVLDQSSASGQRGGAEDMLWRNGTWLHAALYRALAATGDHRGVAPPPYSVLLEVLVRQVRSGHLTSLFGCQLAEAAA